MKQKNRTAYPKLKIREIPLKLEREVFSAFLFNHRGGWGEYILRKHPKLGKAKNEREVGEYLSAFRLKNKKAIRGSVKIFEKRWKEIEEEFFALLPRVLGTEWPKNKTITVYVSANPISPRFLDDWSFSMHYKNSSSAGVREFFAHEILHFLYFKKWKEVFPEAKRKTFDYPHIEWTLSEILAPIILNNSPIKKLLKRRAGSYDEHEKIKIGRNNLVKHFENLYKKSLRENKPFGDFLKIAYKEILKRKNKLKQS